MNYLLLYFRKIFTVDLRALALMRIMLAAVILTDLAIRSTDLEAHYTNLGVLPLHVLFQYAWNPYFISIHTFNGLWQIQALLFLITAIATLMLLFGYKTRLATGVTWLLLVSLHNRNTLIAQGGDDLIRMLLFWAMFMPWGAFYSVDASRKNPDVNQPTQYFSIGTAAYILQICILYVFTALIKTGPEWTSEGTALYYALSLDQILMPGGKLLYPYPELLKLLTHFTLFTELYLPILLLIPFYNWFFRLVVVGVLASFHVGISLTLFVGLFYLINFASLAGLLPAPAMNWLDKKLILAFTWAGNQLRKLRPGWLNTAFPRFTLTLTRPNWFTPFRKRFFREAAALFFLLYVISWNLDSTVSKGLLPDKSKWIGHFLRIDQYWGMFAPTVFKDDGWYILEGRTVNAIIDLNRDGKPLDYVKPESVMRLFKNDRWRKYGETYLFVHNANLRPYYCNFMLRRWNERNPTNPITHLDVVYMKEVSLPDYQVPPARREVLCSCAIGI